MAQRSRVWRKFYDEFSVNRSRQFGSLRIVRTQLHLLLVLEDFNLVCPAAFYLSFERGTKGTAIYVKDLAQSAICYYDHQNPQC
jgi:hypothetical protein